jgi:hypothetical protein
MPVRIVVATHVRVTFAKFGCMYGNSMSLSGFGWSIITVNASNVRGPHSLECGVYVVLLHLIHIAVRG